jgi:hypothetical protein
MAIRGVALLVAGAPERAVEARFLYYFRVVSDNRVGGWREFFRAPRQLYRQDFVGTTPFQ